MFSIKIYSGGINNVGVGNGNGFSSGINIRYEGGIANGDGDWGGNGRGYGFGCGYKSNKAYISDTDGIDYIIKEKKQEQLWL